MIIPIVLSTDHKYIMPTGITIRSLLNTASHAEYDIFVLISADVTESDKQLIKEQANETAPALRNLTFINMGGEFDTSMEIRGISKACYYRLLIPWILPQYDKVVYSDVDIIFKSDLCGLYETEIKDALVAGVTTPIYKRKRNYSRHIRKIGLNPLTYINSGFLLINCKQQREENLKDQYKQLSQKKFLFQDQDIINLVCKNRIYHIPEIYNMSPSLLNAENRENVAVIHYNGEKPWKSFTFGWLEWWDCYRYSIFFDYNFYKSVSRDTLNRKKMIISFLKKGVEQLLKVGL